MRHIEKPRAGEYPSYADIYIGLLPNDGLVLKHLADNLLSTLKLIQDLPEEKLAYRYAKNKWTIKEILVHIIDDERIYVYRALRFARNDATELPSFDQDDFATHSGANNRSSSSILDEYSATRKATITFFEGLEDQVFTRAGIANGNRMTVRALAYHIAGHEIRHVNIIKERYLEMKV